MNINDSRYSRTAQAIDQAFFSLMREKDFRSISVSDIAKRAQINRATFYHHYLDKYDWLDQRIHMQMQEIVDVCRDVHYEDGANDQLEKFQRILRHFDQNFSFYTLMLKNEGTLFFQRRFREIIKEIIHQKVLVVGSRSMDPDFLVQYAACSCAGLIEWWIKEKRPIPSEEMAQYMYSLFVHLPA
ncbi:TetR/AcrR family transcriptional regulator [Butyricicoccus sp.]|uniref:TetR/AcrR family transcriptional regulator n=1 Tax=Butyricicoccus sp. TaxID=2049021 RepID=UPI003F13E2B8